MVLPEWGTAGILEIVWTMLGLFGVGFSFAGLRDALADRDTVNEITPEVNPELKVIANSAVRNERALLGIQSVFATVGLIALTLPSGNTETDWARTSIGIALLFGEGLAVWNSLQNRLDRHKVLNWNRG